MNSHYDRTRRQSTLTKIRKSSIVTAYPTEAAAVVNLPYRRIRIWLSMGRRTRSSYNFHSSSTLVPRMVSLFRREIQNKLLVPSRNECLLPLMDNRRVCYSFHQVVLRCSVGSTESDYHQNSDIRQNVNVYLDCEHDRC